MSHHHRGLLKVLKGCIQKLCDDIEWYLMHHHVLWLPKPLIGWWCKRTYPNPGELILMTISAVRDCLCLLVWSPARDDRADKSLKSRPTVTESSFVHMTVHKPLMPGSHMP